MARDYQLIKRFYRSLYRIRKTEEKIVEVYPTDKIKSPIHLSIGQEVVSVGVCEALRTDDVVCATCRGHATYLAKGGDLRSMISELYGKTTGCSKGKGGSMHLVDNDKGIVGTTAIMGSNIPISVGYAFASKYNRKDSVVAVFFGDGAVDEGAFHESINFAALKRLPILFVCENNSYAIHSHHLDRHLTDNIWERAFSYGVISKRVEKSDVFEIYSFVSSCISKMRKREIGPVFIECMTSRWKEHVGPNDDFQLGYRTYLDMEKWINEDALKELRGLLETTDKNSIEEEVNKEIMEAFEFAENSSFPTSEDLLTDVWA